MEITVYFQAIVNGLFIGMLYVVVTLGIALVLGIMGIVNFAHGEFYMMGAILVWYFFGKLGFNYYLALLVSVLGVAIMGMATERIFFRPFRGKLLEAFIVALALVVIIPNATTLAVGGMAKQVPSVFSGVLKVWSISFSNERLTIMLTSAVLVVLLFLFIRYTKIGRALRAVSQDVDAAQLQGISLNYASSLSMGIGCALAALAAGLVAPIYGVTPWIGGPMIMKSMIIIIIGGMGSIPGVVLGGLLLGFMEAFGTLWVSAPTVALLSFVLIIIVLLVRPHGLLGHA